jgi:cobalt/nickel transport system permease protein
MHVPDGILPAPICLAGFGFTSLTAWFCLRTINRSPEPTQGIPKAALLTAAFFSASLVHIPIPPASVHFVLNGLLGVVLGYYAFLAILVGLFLQAVMFGHGGLTTLGINALIMGVPALIAYFVFRLGDRFPKTFSRRLITGLLAFLAGALGVGLATVLFFSVILFNLPSDLNAEAERAALATLVISHLPLIGLEGIFTAIVVLFLERVKPELLRNPWSKAAS